MKRLLIAHLVALAMLLTTGAGARATSILPDDVTWTYTFTTTPGAVFADGNPGAGVNFTVSQPGQSANGSSDIVAANLTEFSTATVANPDKLATNGNYAVSLQIQTSVAGPIQTATFDFTGKLSGTFSANNSNVSNAFGPNSTQTVQLGGYNFTVSLTSYTPPGPPNAPDSTSSGAIGAHVTVSAITPTQTTPEPSTILLSGLGLSLLGGATWRKRRKAQVEVTA